MREGSLGKSIPVCSLVETVHWERGPTDSGATMEAVLTFPVDAVFPSVAFCVHLALSHPILPPGFVPLVFLPARRQVGLSEA